MIFGKQILDLELGVCTKEHPNMKIEIVIKPERVFTYEIATIFMLDI